MARNKINKIKIENPFERIVTVIDNNKYSYNELDIEEDLDIVKERLSTSKRLSFEVGQTSSNKTSISVKVGYKMIASLIRIEFWKLQEGHLQDLKLRNCKLRLLDFNGK